MTINPLFIFSLQLKFSLHILNLFSFYTIHIQILFIFGFNTHLKMVHSLYIYDICLNVHIFNFIYLLTPSFFVLLTSIYLYF
jgi:hypothetical protein